MSHANIPAGRVARLIRILDGRAQGLRPDQIMRREGISEGTLRLDNEILSAHSRAELEVMVARRTGPRPPPKIPRGACVYTVVRADKVHGCGRTCDGQYCEEHKRAVTPGGSVKVSVGVRTLLSANGGKAR